MEIQCIMFLEISSFFECRQCLSFLSKAILSWKGKKNLGMSCHCTFHNSWNNLALSQFLFWKDAVTGVLSACCQMGFLTPCSLWNDSDSQELLDWNYRFKKQCCLVIVYRSYISVCWRSCSGNPSCRFIVLTFPVLLPSVLSLFLKELSWFKLLCLGC